MKYKTRKEITVMLAGWLTSLLNKIHPLKKRFHE